MQAMAASFPSQQDIAAFSLAAVFAEWSQHAILALPSAAFWQQGHCAFASDEVAVLGEEAGLVVWLVVCAHEATVRARMSSIIFFMMTSTSHSMKAPSVIWITRVTPGRNGYFCKMSRRDGPRSGH